MTVHSQLAPLPTDVPFRLVSKTIGSGAYACIKKAIPADASEPVFAVKFIHKAYAQKHGRVSQKQLDLEITLHSHLCAERAHQNIIQFFQAGDDNEWKWIAMELAEGGDLFDKIESDVGVGEDIAHAYFTQLVSAVDFMHRRGVGHRDIKPENILLSLDGNLKIADFGLATLFAHGGKRKSSKTSCGSPPYTAPEVVRCEGGLIKNPSLPLGYFADQVDIWSCGVVLFVLLVGNTPWDEPSDKSYEFHEYVVTKGHPKDELFERLPPLAYDLLRGILTVDPTKRRDIKWIRQHGWFRRPNRFLKPDGSLANPVALATTMFETMRIDFTKDPYAPSSQSQSQQQRGNSLYSNAGGAGEDDDIMDVDASQMQTRTNTTIAATSYDAEPTPTAEVTFDWDKPALTQPQPGGGAGAGTGVGASISFTPQYSPTRGSGSNSMHDMLAEEPTMSQFTPAPAVPLSRTQYARRFADILPAERMTRFFSPWPLRPLLEAMGDALRQLGVPMPDDAAAGLQGGEELASLRLSTRDGRGQKMRGEVLVEVFPYEGGECCQVSFVKMNGDPLEWRRLFKRVVVICKEAVYVPEED